MKPSDPSPMDDYMDEAAYKKLSVSCRRADLRREYKSPRTERRKCHDIQADRLSAL